MNNLSTRAVIPVIIERHFEDAAFLWLQRDSAVTEPHYDLKDLVELDERLAAHLDGLKVAGDYAWELALQGLEINEPGEVFVAAWLAVLNLDGHKLDQVLDVAQSNSENYRALVSALAWHKVMHTQSLMKSFLQANDSDYLRLGVHLSALKRLGSQDALLMALRSDNDLLVARSLRAIGELGCKELLGQLAHFYSSENIAFSFWANWSAVILGDVSKVETLKHHVINITEFAYKALELIARVLTGDNLKKFLQTLAQKPETIRFAMQGAGMSGDPFWIAGILKYMQEPALARVCGEAFCLITGVDLAYQDLECAEPDDFESGPNDDPQDEDVSLDEDDDLPWPDIGLVEQWWRAHAAEFAVGQRYLCGQLITEKNCNTVLLKSFQRQRIAASLELALLGKGFFNTREKGKTQQRLLLGGLNT